MTISVRSAWRRLDLLLGPHIYFPESIIYTSLAAGLNLQSHNAQRQQHQRHQAESGRDRRCFTWGNRNSMRQMDQEDKNIFNLSSHCFSLTLNTNLPDWAISTFVTSTYHQLIVSHLRHGEVHEVPASDVDFPVDVACLSEHDLENKKQQRFATFPSQITWKHTFFRLNRWWQGLQSFTPTL